MKDLFPDYIIKVKYSTHKYILFKNQECTLKTLPSVKQKALLYA